MLAKSGWVVGGLAGTSERAGGWRAGSFRKKGKKIDKSLALPTNAAEWTGCGRTRDGLVRISLVGGGGAALLKTEGGRRQAGVTILGDEAN